MRLEKLRLLFKWAFLIIVLSGCRGKDIAVFFPDPVLNEVREHKIIDKENLVLSEQPVKIWPLSKAEELICTTLVSGRQIKEDIIYFKKNCVCK